MNIAFFDIDGTLANGFDVPESAQKALSQLRKNGTLVFICTGRPINYVKEHFGAYADGYICFNGRYAELNDTVLYDEPLTKEEEILLRSRLEELHAGYHFYNNAGSYQGGWIDGSYHIYPEGERPVYNFNIHFKDFEHYKNIAEGMKDLVVFNPHGPMLHADATVLGKDKGTAIQHVVASLQIPFENTYAFGDGANDICMLKAVAHGIAMGNALPEVKKVAEFVTSDIGNDGIFHALKHYELI